MKLSSIENMERKFKFSEGEYYHIYNRGVDKRDIFMNEEDRIRFQRMLYISNSTTPYVYRDVEEKRLTEIKQEEPLVAIGAYCLMTNHFHILIKEISEGGISRFMEKLSTGYAMYFNTKYERTGALFQGKFKAEHVNDDIYLKYLYAYIHLNPVKIVDKGWGEKVLQNPKQAKKFIEEYPYSSHADYSEGGAKREEHHILTQEEFPGYFSRGKDFDAYLKDWLNYSE